VIKEIEVRISSRQAEAFKSLCGSIYVLSSRNQRET
jgi:hypothetical protein